MVSPPAPRVLAIVGPTGSGKSEVALAVARAARSEILSCDSVQVFRGFEIGCAKPTAAERSSVPHHLIDVADPHSAFDAQQYRALARVALTEIRSRGSEPIVCGGTGLYLRSLRFGLVAAPAADPVLRAALLAEEEARPGTLYARLEVVDPASARATPRQNLVRVVRALEVTQLSGRRASELRTEHGFAVEEVPLRVIYLEWPAEFLKERIRARSALMLERGLVDEVRGLLEAGVDPDCRPINSVGYREATAVVRGEAPLRGLAERISQSTWAYARRQRTWFRRERDVEVWPVSDLGEVATRLVADDVAG